MSDRIAWPKLRYPLVAILRGIRPDETEAVVSALIETGFEAIEIPLNSPEPFISIEKAVRLAPENVLIGAGTVLSVENVDRLNDVGGRLLVSPNVEPDVIRRAGKYGMATMPGVFTPTEAFSAIHAGASALKFGSDSHLMISRWKLTRLSERNQHHGDPVSSVVPDPGRIDC